MVICSSFSSRIGGSSVVMRQLLDRFNPASYTVITMKRSLASGAYAPQDHEIRILSTGRLPERLQKLWQTMQIPIAVRSLRKELERRNVRVILGVYPNLEFLMIAQRVAKSARIPLVAYLHDTIVEGLSHTHLKRRAEKLQKDVFSEASDILVMSDGLVDLYRSKHGIRCHALPHIYPEPIVGQVSQEGWLQQGFWSGTVYGINSAGLRRVSDALSAIHIPFLLTTNRSIQNLAALGIRGDGIRVDYIINREQYLKVLKQQGVLVLALSWPDESPTHTDELSTIFPTKTPDYLASGRPILVHCPKDYFLARFFEEHKCGLVVSERSPDALAMACRQLLKGDAVTQTFRQRALVAARLFAPASIVETLRETLDRAASVRWSEKVL